MQDIEFWRNKCRELEAERDNAQKRRRQWYQAAHAQREARRAIKAKTIEECAVRVEPFSAAAAKAIRALAQQKDG